MTPDGIDLSFLSCLFLCAVLAGSRGCLGEAMKQLACGERRRDCVSMIVHSAQAKLTELWLSNRTASLTDSCWKQRLSEMVPKLV